MMDDLEKDLREVKLELEQGLAELKKAQKEAKAVEQYVPTITAQHLRNVEANTVHQIKGINALFDLLAQDRKEAEAQRQKEREKSDLSEGGSYD
tara:strand:- start:1385 stop:1666 length:282 start_codon:yes stop_codon:yes gene_type:complete